MFLLCSFLIAAATYAYDSSTVNEKVLKVFNETFTGAEEVHWNEFSDHYTVNFLIAGVRSKADYDKEGNMISCIRYYRPNALPLNILGQLKRQYPARTLYGVTEVTAGSNIVYFVKMDDARHWYTVKIDGAGETEQSEKYRKN